MILFFNLLIQGWITVKILHTSDWHLGVSLDHATREREHQRFLNWLIDTMREEAVEVLLIAGDIFHHSQPSASAQADYYRFLTRCTQLPALRQVVVVGGNHDSASRLDAPRDVLGFLNVHTVGGISVDQDSWERCICPIKNPETDEVEAVVIAVPFVQEARLGILTTRFSEVEINKQYEIAFQELYTHLADLANERYGAEIPLIATGHLACADANWKRMSGDFNSEIHQVGTIGALPLSIFDERYDYVALGHIHHCRQLGTRNIWYSGTPVATRPEESTSDRQVLLVDIDSKSNVTVSPIVVPIWRRILTFEGTPEEIYDQLRALKTDPDTELQPYLYINLIVEMRNHLDIAHFTEFLTEITPEGQLVPRILNVNKRLSAQAKIETSTETTQHPSLKELSTEAVFTLLYELKNQSSPDEEIMIAFRSLLTDDGEADLAELEAVHKENA